MSGAGALIPNATLSGGLVGGHAGYNWQYGQVVGGLEVDYTSADLNQSSLITLPGFNLVSRQAKVDELASARGRLGWAALPNVLLYGTGGLGFGHASGSLSAPGTFSTSADENAFGWVAGTGLEYRLFERLLLRAEYLHYGLGRVSFPGLSPFFSDVNVRNDIDVVRGGISYKF
jgi:outer membrane immunogenic protein